MSSNTSFIDAGTSGCIHTNLLKCSSRTHEQHAFERYGSTGTFSTEYITSSSSSSSEDEKSTSETSLKHNNNGGAHSRESSYSDFSSDGGAGYYDRYARHRQNESSNYFQRYLVNMPLHNLKVLFSAMLWYTCYMIMGIFGGSVAYLHFERSDKDVPDPLPDFGYDLIPYYCPAIPHLPHGNVQSMVLFILYAIIMSSVVLRWNPVYHPKTRQLIRGGDGRLILQHLFHLNCLIFLTRTTTVGSTGMPQPNPKCVNQQHEPVTFSNALQFVMGRGLVPHACGDLIYSGHVGCTLICMAVLHHHGFLKHPIAAVTTWMVAGVGIYFTISCRSHYSVDVVLAFYFGYFLTEWYFVRSDGRVEGILSSMIRRLEVRPADLRSLEYDNIDISLDESDLDIYPTTIVV